MLLMSTSYSYSDQTFTTPSQQKTDYYYQVPVDVEITETGTPTDFILGLTYDQGATRELLTPTPVEWGNFNPTGIIEWIPNQITNGATCYMDIIWGNRGDMLAQYNWQTAQSADDVTVPFQVSPGNIDFISNLTYDSIPKLDDFVLTWGYDQSTLPDQLLIQYSLKSTGGWNDLSVVDVDRTNSTQSYTFFNNRFFNDNDQVRFKITYVNGSGNGYPLTITSWKSLKYCGIDITNRVTLSTAILDNNDIITIELNKEGFTREDNLIEVYGEYLDNENPSFNRWQGTIEFDDNTFSFRPDVDYTGRIRLTFSSVWGEVLDLIVVNVKDKYITMSSLSSEYDINEPIVIAWSNSDNYDNSKVKIEISLDTGNTYQSIVDDWNVSDGPYATYYGEQANIVFRISASDDYSTSLSVSQLVTIGEPCKEDSLQTVIDGLKNENLTLSDQVSRLSNQVDSLNLIIDKFEPNTVLVTLIKDLRTNVDVTKVIDVNETATVEIQNGSVDLNDEVFEGRNWVYVVNLSGQIVFENQHMVKGSVFITNVDSYPTGVYVIYILNESRGLDTYKFIR